MIAHTGGSARFMPRKSLKERVRLIKSTCVSQKFQPFSDEEVKIYIQCCGLKMDAELKEITNYNPLLFKPFFYSYRPSEGRD